MNILRNQMIEGIKLKYDLLDPVVFSAMLKIPREKFVPLAKIEESYSDSPVSIGYGQTISQPYTVAFMTHLLKPAKADRVLEIGTGSGYQAAILSLLVKEVFSVEIIPELSKKAEQAIKSLNINNVYIKTGDGKFGWVEKSPFNKIIITAGVSEVPKDIIDQLSTGGLLVAPIGEGETKIMTRILKVGENLVKDEFGKFHFVPFV